MAANTLANIAAATAAGYVLERYTDAAGRNHTRLSKKTAGAEGKEGANLMWEGEATTSGNADTAALANLNAWRNNRYGVDSAAASLSPTPTAATSPTTQGVTPSQRSMTKDRD